MEWWFYAPVGFWCLFVFLLGLAIGSFLNVLIARLPLDFIRASVGKVFDGAYSTGELDKFRTRIERVEGGTEVYITHHGVEERIVAPGGDAVVDPGFEGCEPIGVH